MFLLHLLLSARAMEVFKALRKLQCMVCVLCLRVFGTLFLPFLMIGFTDDRFVMFMNLSKLDNKEVQQYVRQGRKLCGLRK